MPFASAQAAFMASGCEQGYFERLDWSMLPDKSRFLPATVNNTECGIGFLAGVLVMGYDALNHRPIPPRRTLLAPPRPPGAHPSRRHYRRERAGWRAAR